MATVREELFESLLFVVKGKGAKEEMEKYEYGELKAALAGKLARYYNVTVQEAGKEQFFGALQLVVRDILSQKRAQFKDEVKKNRSKRIYYLCIEFLIGRQLKNNVMNLGIEKEVKEILGERGLSFDDVCELETDPGLGNGGLGRLAACFMDALTTGDYPATGCSILYDYGMFKQKIIDGQQVELPDIWLPSANSSLIPRNDKAVTVRFGGRIKECWRNGHLDIIHTDYEEVQAIPYDLLISGYDSRAVNTLRLYRAKDTRIFNMNLFSQGEYVKAIQESSNAEVISKVLYPADNHTGGKLLRLTQQYFLVSASLQNIISDHMRRYGTLSNFSEKVALHVNDTHPALVIPELMRLLIDIYSYSWENAWKTVTETVTYTNHTVLPEALECWNQDLFGQRLPRIHSIICEINRRFCADLWNAYPGDWERISRMSIICNDTVRMANLSVVGSHTVNGVSELHSEILKKTVFSDFYAYTPWKFTNVTNGIAHRRWLCFSNPGLAGLLDETIGTDYRKKPEKLLEFRKYRDDLSVLEELQKIKRQNKVRFAEYCRKRTGIILDPDSLFDVQIKRMHEYKRQLLNCLQIISVYDTLLENPDAPVLPQTFIFGAKAAPGYYMAKEIIRLIWNLSKDIEDHPAIAQKLKVVFMEDYNVSMAEVLIPAADVSEQISLAGKEASGTGNMKLMINGALTVGTYDGANIEMAQRVGEENIYIFGLRNNEVDELWKKGYSSFEYYNNSETLRRVVQRLNAGFNGRSFQDMVSYLLMSHGVADPYMCFADFEDYSATCARIRSDYPKREKWSRMSLENIAGAGFFAADRSIAEYADKIWHLKAVK